MTKKTIFISKIALSIVTALFITLAFLGFFNKVPTAYASTTPVAYSADFSNGLPYDWSEYNRSDVTLLSAPKKSGSNLILEHDITRTNENMESLYYGGVYRIAQSLGDISDFTLTLTYRVLDSRDDSRWLGVMYHTQETLDGRLSGYLMNYRVNGKSAASIVQNTPKYNDFNVVDSTGIAHDKTTFITLKITVSGNTATHYVNNQVITSYNFENKTDLLAVQKSGGFALVVNISKVEIKNLTIEGQAKSTQKAYAANFANGLPTDWSKNSKGATEEFSHQNVTDGVKLTHTGSQEKETYFGGFYNIATGLTNATDFTLEAKVLMNSYENDARWFGIAYRKQENSNGYSSFYLMNYRQNGKTAFSTVTSAPVFNDDHTSESSLTQGNSVYRTMRIVVQGQTAYHYIDNVLMQKIDLQSKESILGNTQTAGGFALLFNKCSITICSLWIKAEVLADNSPNTSAVSNPKLEYSPTIVTEADAVSDINNRETKEYADSMIFEVDANLNVVSNGSTLTTLKDALYKTYSSSLPIVRIKNSTIANAFINYIDENKITDIAVISTDTNLLKTIRTSNAGKNIRAILDWTQNSTPLNSKTAWQSVVNTTNACRANVALLRETDATKDAVTYIQARLMTVWVKQASYSTYSTHCIVTTGAYGIVTANPTGTYNDFTTYTDTLPLLRSPYNIAHRGIPNDYPEGSLYGFKKAYETGATHLEVDVHLTSDGQLVVMHDNTIDRTTTGSGTVKNMTLAEIKKYKIARLYNGTYVAESSYQPIPSLAEVFDYFKDKDIVYALEIKSNESNIVQKLKELIDQYNVKHQIFVITFKINVLEQMRDVLPEVPSALLGGHLANGNNTTAFTANDNMLDADRYVQIANLATNLDLTKGSAFLTETLKHRGYMSYFWTYQEQTNIETAFKDGVLGITNNKSISIENYARYLQAIPQDYNVYNMQTILTNGLTMRYVTYGKDTVQCQGKVHAYNDCEYYTDVIFKYSYTSNTNNLTYTLYSESVRIINPEYYMTVGQISTLLNTPVSNFTLDDIASIEKAKIAYGLLTDSDKSSINIAKADQLIDEITRVYSNHNVLLNYDSAKGSITGVNNGDSFDYGATVTLTIKANAGYKITSIILNGQSLNFSNNKASTIQVSMTKDYTLAVEFAVDEDYVEDDNTGDDTGSTTPDGDDDDDNTGDDTDDIGGGTTPSDPSDDDTDNDNTSDNTDDNSNGNNNTNNGGNGTNTGNTGAGAITCVMMSNSDASVVFIALVLALCVTFVITKRKARKN